MRQYIFDPEKEFIPWQRQINARPESFKGVLCSRGTGKTAWETKLSLVHAMAGHKCTFWLQTLNILRTEWFPQRILPQIEAWNIPKSAYSYNKSDHIIEFTGGGIIRGFSYEAPENCTGLDKVVFNVFDEATTAKDWDSVLRATVATQRGLGGIKAQSVFGCTPRPGSRFSHWLKEHPDVYCMRGITMRDNPYVTEDEIRDMERLYGIGSSLYRQEMLGEELDGDVDCAVFPANIFSKIVKTSRGFRSLGIDCAGAGRDFNVFTVSDDVGILEKVRVQIADTFQLAAIARNLIEKWNVRLVNIDTTGGFGIGLYDMLKLEYNFVNGINFGQSADDNDSYVNVRAEMFFELANDCKDGFFVEDELVREELAIMSWYMSPTGKTGLIKKEVMKQVLGRSPDDSDSLALSRHGRKKVMQMQEEQNYDIAGIASTWSDWG